jgi:hypothetical protein
MSMGIDVYLRWRGWRAEEEAGFDTKRGYLRESYHGGPYVTPYFVVEAFEVDDPQGISIASIPASVLRERLPAAVLLAEYRHHVVYGEGQNPRRLELPAGMTFEEGLAAIVGKMCAHLPAVRDGEAGQIAACCTPEQLTQAKQRIEARDLHEWALRFVDFVELAELKEAEMGELCWIVLDA